MSGSTKQWVSTILSIIIPGSGQVFNGQIYKTLAGYSALLFLPVVWSALKLQFNFSGWLFLFLLVITIYFAGIFDARRNSRADKFKSPLILNFLALSLLLAVVLAYIVLAYVKGPGKVLNIRTMKVIANSMAPTIQTGDFLVVDTRDDSRRSLVRFEIVMFHNSEGLIWSKRVIGLPGEAVRGDGERIWINEQPLDETPYLNRQDNLLQNNGDSGVIPAEKGEPFGPVIVPSGCVFLVGDNRQNSFDSRNSSFGCIHRSRITGKPRFILWSGHLNRIGKSLLVNTPHRKTD